MGFGTVSIGLGVLMALIKIYIGIRGGEWKDIGHELMEFIAGYGLGGSAMALFSRVGGGIYTKAADVGADLVGKVEEGLEEDSPRNPATIADNVGDNVGDIAGMGSDLFGSFAESTCAALVIIANIDDLKDSKDTIYFPLLISAYGIIACIISSVIGIYVYKVNEVKKINTALMLQLVLSTLLSIVGIYFAANVVKEKFFYEGVFVYRSNLIIITVIGLINGFLIGMITNYYTSYDYSPV
jgi:Na+/H+-translocating membrane pyrophosphatase